jgi:ATP-dependent Clp protease ATP-binding subunit ClpA
MGSKILEGAGVTLDRARLALNLTPKTLVINMGGKGLSETAKLTLKMAWEIAQEFNQDYCGTEHILYSILSQKNARATTLLRDMSVDIDNLAPKSNSSCSASSTKATANPAKAAAAAKAARKRLWNFLARI